MNRCQMLERVFERDAKDYPDVRHLNHPVQIRRRVEYLLSSLSNQPLKKQSCRTNRRTLNELQLLKAKLICMGGMARAADETQEAEAQAAFGAALKILSATNLSVINSGQKQEKHERDRRVHTLILMHFIYAKYSTDESLKRALRL